MSNRKPEREMRRISGKKNKIIKRVRKFNFILLAAVLLLITAALAFIVSDITSNASQELARLYSHEAVGKFTVYINRDIALIQKLSHSRIVKDWLADEDNASKKTAAYNDILNHADLLQNASMYLGIHKSLNEYAIESTMPIERFTPIDKLVYANPLNYWFYNCINADTEYTLNIDTDRVTNMRNLWINHKVIDGQDIAGVFSIGLQFELMANDLFSHYDSRYVRGLIIDKNSIIKMDSSDSLGNGVDSLFSADPLFDSIVESYREKTSGFFDPDTEPSLIKLDRGTFRYVYVAPIAGTDWLVVIFFNNRSLFSVVHLLPLIITMLSAFFLYILTERIFMHRIVLAPLTGLTNSISKTESAETEDIFGKERNDEIGELARTIQKMKDGLLEASREHERLMRTDQLTNIPNRRYFDERLTIEWERAARTKTPISMLMLDLDHFKKYNDTYGHLNGDRVLQQTAKLFMRELKRPADFVVRWGGEEFVVILPDTDSNGALYIGECIRKSIEDEPIFLEDGTITKITVSIGVNTIIPTKNCIPSDFIRQADDALYKAKETGRNRVCLFSSM